MSWNENGVTLVCDGIVKYADNIGRDLYGLLHWTISHIEVDIVDMRRMSLGTYIACSGCHMIPIFPTYRPMKKGRNEFRKLVKRHQTSSWFEYMDKKTVCLYLFAIFFFQNLRIMWNAILFNFAN